jgi:hypothetical protein
MRSSGTPCVGDFAGSKASYLGRQVESDRSRITAAVHRPARQVRTLNVCTCKPQDRLQSDVVTAGAKFDAVARLYRGEFLKPFLNTPRVEAPFGRKNRIDSTGMI